jgi:PPM family protein phosphatase
MFKNRTFEIGTFCDRGAVRKGNQDRVADFDCPVGHVCVIADGMGGHEGGELAAEMTVSGFAQHLHYADDERNLVWHLREAARSTNTAIYSKAHSGEPGTTGMGSTVVIGVFRDNQLLVGHAGDSRAYLLRDKRLSRLTHDHSVVQRMIDHNVLTKEEARVHPQANVITRSLGQSRDVDLEITGPVPLKSGDGVLLCSDGICGYLTDEQIEAALVHPYAATEDAVRALGNLAIDSGSDDNITAQLIRIGSRQWLFQRVTWVILAAVIIVAALLRGFISYRHHIYQRQGPKRVAAPAAKTTTTRAVVTPPTTATNPPVRSDTQRR